MLLDGLRLFLSEQENFRANSTECWEIGAHF